jgi:hypothetical protein
MGLKLASQPLGSPFLTQSPPAPPLPCPSWIDLIKVAYRVTHQVFFNPKLKLTLIAVFLMLPDDVANICARGRELNLGDELFGVQ